MTGTSELIPRLIPLAICPICEVCQKLYFALIEA